MTEATQTIKEQLRLDLKIPQRKAVADSFFHSDEKVDQWLEGLPLANIGESAKLLYKALSDMNRTEIPVLQRAKYVEKFRQPIHNMVDGLEKHFTDVTFPLSDKARKVVLLCRELLSELAIAYKIIIQNVLEQTVENIDRNLLIITLHRACYYLCQVIYFSSRVYEPYPLHTWHELHGLFFYSFKNKVDTIKVKNGLDKNGAESSITHLYKQILLLAIASPYQMRQRDIQTLFKQLSDWASYGRLSSLSDKDEEQEHSFVINLFSDTPPIHTSIYPDKLTSFCIRLETEQLLGHLKEYFKQETENDMHRHHQEISYNLRKLITQNWSEAPHRRYVRTQLNFELNLAVGLNGIHELIEVNKGTLGSDHFTGLQNKPKKKPSDSVRRSSLFLGEDDESEMPSFSLEPIDDNLSHRDSILRESHLATAMSKPVASPFENKPSKPAKPKPETTNVKTVNESAGGYCIEWNGQKVPGIKVGELIGIQSVSSDIQFGLSVTRWLKNVPGTGLLVGIQVISHSCRTASVREAKVLPKHKGQNWFSALILPGESMNANTIIVPSDLFEPGHKLFVKNDQNKHSTIELGSVIESTGLFSHYKYIEHKEAGQV